MTLAPRPPTVRQLQYLSALDAEQHFGRAAASCHISQPAFSVAIRELETLLGVSLVDRNNRRVTMTRAGRDLANQARLVLRDLAQLTELAAARQSVLEGPLTLGVIPTVAPFLLPRCLPAVREHFSKLKLYIREDRSAELVERLADGELDVVVLALPYPLEHVNTMPLLRERFLLAYRKGTNLIDPGKFSVNRVTAASVLLLEDGHCLREHAMAACKVRDLEPVNDFAASSLLTLIEMVDSDLGITFLPELAIGSSLLHQTRIETRPLPDSGSRDIVLAWRKSSSDEQDFQRLGNVIRETLRT